VIPNGWARRTIIVTTAVIGTREAPVGTVSSVDEDAVLVARLTAGDDVAIGELFDRHGSYVLGLARRITGDTASAEDVLQEVFTALWTSPQRFDANRGSLRAFLGMQAHGRAIDAVRRDTRRRVREDNVAMSQLVRDGTNGRDAIEAATTAEVVHDAIARLPAEQRAAVELVFWKGLTYREVATALAIPEGTAKSRLRLAQARLSEWLAPLSGEPV
jgi:RNA polymerase sigma-70 factor (ECF subfamily)